MCTFTSARDTEPLAPNEISANAWDFRFCLYLFLESPGNSVVQQATILFRKPHFLAFAKLRKATISFDMSVCPSIRMEQLGCHWTFHEI